MDEWTDICVEETVLLKLDANSKYWRVKIEDKDKDKIGFTSHPDLVDSFAYQFGFAMGQNKTSVPWRRFC